MKRNRYSPRQDIEKMKPKRAWRLYGRTVWKEQRLLDRIDRIDENRTGDRWSLSAREFKKREKLIDKLNDLYVVDYCFRAKGYC